MPNNDTEVEDAVVDDDTAVGVAAIDDDTEVEDAAVDDDDDDDGDVDIETAPGGWENLVKEVDNLPRQKSAVEAKAAGKIDLDAGGPYRLLVAETIRKILATSPHLFLLNGMYASRIAPGSRKAATTATITELTPLSATNEVYRLAARIHALKEVRSGVWEDVAVPVPADAVLLALAEPEKIGLRSICGVTSAPLLREGGDIRYDDGFDEDAEVWCHNVPKLCILDSPAYGDAKVALWYIRDNFKTFPFGDAETVFHPGLGVPVVDLGQPIGMDETTFLNALLTAACRASLFLAPGWALTAPEGGGGSGKGLLIQSVSQIAFGISPHPNTHNGDDKEFDKRIAGAYKSGSPVVYIDNVNSTMLKSDSLASKVTERPFIIRVLGETGDYVIDSSAWVVITGNGLKVTEDLVRRFLATTLDAKVENASARPFKDGRDAFLATIKARRVRLLEAVLTIWRWGQQGCQGANAEPGKSVGSFETWGRWVRDPLLALGCKDPMTRISESMAEDPAKIRTVEAFVAWHGKHGCGPVSCKTAAADFEVARRFVPDGVVWSGTWQSLVPHLTAKNNTRAIGAVFKRVEDPNRGGGAVAYQVKIEDADRWMAATGIRVDPKTGEADRGATTGDNVVQFPNKPDAADEFVADLGVAG